MYMFFLILSISPFKPGFPGFAEDLETRRKSLQQLQRWEALGDLLGAGKNGGQAQLHMTQEMCILYAFTRGW